MVLNTTHPHTPTHTYTHLQKHLKNTISNVLSISGALPSSIEWFKSTLNHEYWINKNIKKNIDTHTYTHPHTPTKMPSKPKFWQSEYSNSYCEYFWGFLEVCYGFLICNSDMIEFKLIIYSHTNTHLPKCLKKYFLVSWVLQELLWIFSEISGGVSWGFSK